VEPDERSHPIAAVTRSRSAVNGCAIFDRRPYRHDRGTIGRSKRAHQPTGGLAHARISAAMLLLTSSTRATSTGSGSPAKNDNDCCNPILEHGEIAFGESADVLA
jgi:hypothetical protein